MAEKDVEVKTTLKLDDQASAELERIKGGFENVNQSADMAQKTFADWAKDAAAVAVGVNFVPMIKGAASAAKGFIDMSNHAYNVQQSFAGLINIMQDKSWAQSRADAEQWYRRLEDIGINIGQDVDEVTEGFRLMNQVMGASEPQLEKNLDVVRDMTTLANVMGMNVAQVAAEFGGIAMGQVRVRGQLTQLLAQTGIFGDDMSKASTSLRKMGTEAAFNLAAGGLKSLTERLSKAAPTLDDLTNAIGNMWKALQESFGLPVIKAVIPVLKKLKEEFEAGRGEFEKIGKNLGDEVGKWVADSVQVVRDGFKYMVEHGDEFRQAIVDAMHNVRSVIEFIIDHKEVIAAAFGAHMAAPVIGAGAQVASAGIAAVGAAGGGAAAATAVGAAAMKAAGPAAAFAAAAGGIALAYDQWNKLLEENTDLLDNWGKGKGGFFNMIGTYVDAIGEGTTAADAAAKAEAAVREATAGNVKIAQEWLTQLDAMGDAGQKEADRIRQQITDAAVNVAQIDALIASAAGGTDVEPLIEAYNLAVQQGNMAAAKHAASVIVGSQNFMLQAYDASSKITEGFDVMVGRLDESVAGFYDAMFYVGDDKKKGGAAALLADLDKKIPKGGGVSIKNAKFEIQQDFRDQDPDRVAVVFRHDIARAAVRRVQTGRATVFGI